MNRLKLSLLLAWTGLLVGCTSGYTGTNNLNPDLKMSANTRSTVLVYSQLAEGGMSRVFFRDATQVNAKAAFTETVFHPMHSPELTEGGFQGGLKVLSVIGKELDFFLWHWQDAKGVLVGNNWAGQVEIKAGQVVYLGRILISQKDGVAHLSVVDRAEEDLTKFKAAYPHLREVETVKILLPSEFVEEPIDPAAPKEEAAGTF
ncbi:MAG: hypothetical protein RRB13_08240 [bacterium]|nr:hypothetical protein [bacterium]